MFFIFNLSSIPLYNRYSKPSSNDLLKLREIVTNQQMHHPYPPRYRNL
jgi:hypothetical protein